MQGLYVDSSRNAVEHMYNVAGIFVHGACASNVNVYIPVLVVTLLIALSTYEAYIRKVV